MGEDGGSWLHQQYSFLKQPNLNSIGSAPCLGKQSIFQPFVNLHTSKISASGSLPGMTIPVPMLLKRSQGNEEMQQRIFQTLKKPHTGFDSANGYLSGLAVQTTPYPKTSQGIAQQNRFCCIPYYCLPETPVEDIVLKEKLFAPYKCGVEANTKVVPGSFQQRYLIFHQSGHKTNLVLNSLIASPAQNLNLENSSPTERCGSQQKESQAKRDEIALRCLWKTDGFSENHETSEESEMHEDTEEIDALLYTDSEYSDADADEETSTAHSPCDQNQEECEESADEVTSHVRSKRKRPVGEEDEGSFLRDTASSLGLSEYKDDAESVFMDGRGEENWCSSAANRRLKKGKIWDAMSTLQSIIPGEKGKDTTLILDDAIKYLRFLQLKARSLGIALE